MEKNMPRQLIWIDLEMTGLDTARDSILEIATVITDNDLNEIAEGPVFAIAHDAETLQAMDTWNTQHHTESGLWQRVLDSDVGMAEAERRTLEFLGYPVVHVQNFTDIDDKIIVRAAEMGITATELAQQNIDSFFDLI